MNLGEKIKELREARGLTLEGLAKKMNAANASYLWRIENGVHACRWAMVQKLIRAMNLSKSDGEELRALFASRVTDSAVPNDLFELMGKRDAEALRPILRELVQWPSAAVRDLGTALGDAEANKFIRESARMAAKSVSKL